ncbi:TPA: prophage tail fiber N-terminal domain-containing protein [Escherichia coli]|nr:prophage tail fiber N-terminal domain-containing protein [Escherichia coli]
MATRLHGILMDGLNKPIINATVALIAKGNTITVLNGSEAIFRTDGSGAYNVTVQTGRYKVIIGPQGVEPYKAGEIVIYGDSPEGSLNGYLINWAPEELTPDVIKQVQQLVANSEEYALQAGRSAAAANSDATDARNSKAAAASSASEALTYKNDSKTNADAAKQAQSSAAGSANTATQAVTTITNLKKDVEKLKSDTQTIKNSAISETQAIKDAAVSETTALKDAAAASAAQASNSATEAGQQAGNAGTSATAAKNDADRAKTEADRAESAANNAPEIQPFPDVWIPFNDSLDMLAGFAPGYKQITVGDDVIKMPSDKVVDFKRASGATYINKSGVLTVAEVDEPRFERDGLLIEGQRTNYMLNSENPASWGRSSNMDVPETGKDSFGFTYGKFVCNDSLIGQTSAINMASIAATKSVDVSGYNKYVTTSCRFKTELQVRLRIRFDKYDGSATTFLGDAYIDTQTLEINMTGGAASRITARVRKDEATGWIFAEATIQAIDGELKIGSQIQYSPKQSGATVSGDYIYLATPQVEDGPCVSSFIISGATAATRASDIVTVPIKNNLYNLPFTVLCEVHKNWYKTPNAAPRVFDTGGHQTGAAIILGFGSSADYDGFPYCDIGGANRRVNENASLEKMVMGMRVKEDQMTCAVSNGRISSEKKATWSYIQSSATIRIGGQTTTGQRHLFGHVRNLRVWHKALTDRELKESV